MKLFVKLTIYISDFLLICLVMLNINNIKESVYEETFFTYNNSKKLTSNNIVIIDNKTSNTQNKKDNQNNIVSIESNESKKTNINDQEETNVIENKKNETVVSESNDSISSETINIIEAYTGILSGYGPDCYGCTSNKTASGYYVGDGNIYYSDPSYGRIRIVAGDSKYPFGTIVRMMDLSFADSIIAIVLDRGGNIGLDNYFQFDLLYATEDLASQVGISHNVRFEILRLGY